MSISYEFLRLFFEGGGAQNRFPVNIFWLENRRHLVKVQGWLVNQTLIKGFQVAHVPSSTSCGSQSFLLSIYLPSLSAPEQHSLTTHQNHCCLFHCPLNFIIEILWGNHLVWEFFFLIWWPFQKPIKAFGFVFRCVCVLIPSILLIWPAYFPLSCFLNKNDLLIWRIKMVYLTENSEYYWIS